MRLYFAGAFGPYYEYIVPHPGARNVLLTYASEAEWKLSLDALPKYHGRLNLMVDSGAFSIWNQRTMTERPTFKTWLEWIKWYAPAVRPHVRDLTIVTFDTLPGEVGKKPLPHEARASAERSFADWREAVESGINCIPVFHQYEPWDVLDRYLDHTSYLGLSPANDAPTRARVEWLRTQAFPRLRTSPRTRVHLFGFTAPKALTSVAAYSADSSAVYVFGKYRNRYRLRMLEDPGPNPDRRYHATTHFAYYRTPRIAVKEGVELFLQLQRDVTRVWEQRGVVWPLDSTESESEDGVLHLNPDVLRDAPWHAFRMDNERYVGLITSMNRYGCYLPLVVRELEPGTYELVDGHTRKQIARGLPLATVPVINLGAISEAEAMERHLVLNSIRGDLDPMAYAKVFVKLADDVIGPKKMLTIGARSLDDLQAMRAFVDTSAFQDATREREQGDLFSHKVDRQGKVIAEAGAAPKPPEPKPAKRSRSRSETQAAAEEDLALHTTTDAGPERAPGKGDAYEPDDPPDLASLF